MDSYIKNQEKEDIAEKEKDQKHNFIPKGEKEMEQYVNKRKKLSVYFSLA